MKKVTSGQLLNNLLQKILKIEWFIWLMMPFKNIHKIMENTKMVINCLLVTSRSTFATLSQNMTSSNNATQEWSYLYIYPAIGKRFYQSDSSSYWLQAQIVFIWNLWTWLYDRLTVQYLAYLGKYQSLSWGRLTSPSKIDTFNALKFF